MSARPKESTPKPRSSASSHRELVNKSRNGYYGASYIQDVKQYFEHDNVDGANEDQKKEYLRDLIADFRALLESTNDAKDNLHDVEFVESEDVDATSVAAHKQLLIARSATFEALFKSDDFLNNKEYLGFKLLESDNEHVHRVLLPQNNPKVDRNLMEAVLHYIYWGNIDRDLVGENIEGFYQVASFLDLKELRRHLAGDLYEKLKNDENLAIQYLNLSVECGCKYLKRKTIDYIVAHRASILNSDDWKNLAKTKKDLAKEVYDNIIEETNKA